MMKIKIGIIIILSLIMIGCKDKKEEDVDYYPKTVYVDDRGNKVTMLNDSISLGIRSFIVNNSRAIRRRLFPDLEDFEHIGYDGGSKDKINRKRLIGNTYQIYRSILHQLAIDEDWNNVYSDITLPSGDMGTIKVERIDDDKKDNDIK